MYDRLAKDIQNKLTSSEWSLVSYYINKADDLGKAGRESSAKEALYDAIAVARAHGEDNAAGKIQYYLRFY